MPPALFAGVAVRDHDAALPFYEQLLGPATFKAHATETVWDIAEDRSIYIKEEPAVAGSARLAVWVDDLDAAVAEIAGRGLEPALRETHSNGVRKATYHDPDGNEIGFGGAPLT